MAYLDSFLALLFMMMPPFDPNQEKDPTAYRTNKGKGVMGAPSANEGSGGSRSGSGILSAKDKGKGIAIDDGSDHKPNYYDHMMIEDDDDDFDYEEETSTEEDSEEDYYSDYEIAYEYGFEDDFADDDVIDEKKDEKVKDSPSPNPNPNPDSERKDA